MKFIGTYNPIALNWRIILSSMCRQEAKRLSWLAYDSKFIDCVRRYCEIQANNDTVQTSNYVWQTSRLGAALHGFSCAASALFTCLHAQLFPCRIKKKYLEIVCKKLCLNSKFWHICNKSVKQFGSQMRPHILWDLIWIQIVCKGHQRPSKFVASGQS